MFDRARELDAADPLASYRDRFVLPDDTIYLDGNSLGCLPKDTPARIAEVVAHEWGRDLIGSWNTADWIVMPQRIGGKIAPLIGAAPHEVIACDTVSVNLFQLIAAALTMQPGRTVVLSEPGNFPTDLYMIEGLEKQGLATRRLAERDRINQQLQEIIDLQTEPWGVKVRAVEVKQIDLPVDMQRAMAKQAEAEREKRSKVIHAEGELLASQGLADASRILQSEPAALQLRYLQTLSEIATENSSTTIFPIPIDLLRPFYENARDASESSHREG